ncbi:ATP phosphoribosyltransferase regulatory subunit [Petroclostridium sp. X23]|uniref:ATP phosphoribosyltransferase regulatory subunit n=1 Tax=Petroclostridium sp. X23 TaxID=3045146 RepID=UPI0024AE6177|nr:ATP phosphoribosyltransferase regulatory subunit [Petroclostridium sp. X23]WHH58906.1 ATP phosphoribosyltransferase regulatory subunit [Petroclostridium sp. X23]
MLKWKLHTPEGVQDLLQEECIIKREIEEKVTGVFQSYGYYEIQPPTFEFYDVFAGESGLIEQETMFKFFDNQGRIQVLRPDITTPIARIIATKYKDIVPPVRLYYVGNAYRYDEPYQGAKQREFTQAGMELIGTNTPEADAEVIAITIKALIAAGLQEFQIEIGQIEFFKGLMEQAKLPDEEIEKIRMLIDSKDSLAIEELVNGYNIDTKLKDIILSFPSLFGGVEVIDQVIKNTTNTKAVKALSNLRQVYDILLDYGLEKYVSIDLGMVQSINYYTGTIFKGFTHGLGFPVCSGGRYDRLISEFGKDLPAMGVAIGINRLMSALERQKVEFKVWHVDSLIYYTDAGRKRAFQLADELRSQGLIIESCLGNNSYNDVIEYAKRKKIDGIITVHDDENIELHNLNTFEKIKTTVSKLLDNKNN